MKKFIIIFILVLLALPVMAESEYKALKTTGWRMDIGAGVAGSIHSGYAVVDPEFMYDFGFGAAGVGASGIYGLTFQDIYVAPYARLELLWFYLKGGVVFQIEDAQPNAEHAPDGFLEPEGDPYLPCAILGADIPIIPIGKRGKLGLDVNMGLIPTATPVVIYEDGDNFIENIIGSLIASSMSAVFDSFKVGASLYYTVIF